MYTMPLIRVTERTRPFWRNENKESIEFLNPFRKNIIPRFPKVSFLQIGLEEGNQPQDLSWGDFEPKFILCSTLDNSPIIPIPRNYFL